MDCKVVSNEYQFASMDHKFTYEIKIEGRILNFQRHMEGLTFNVEGKSC